MNYFEEIAALITSSIIFPYAFWNSFSSKLNAIGYVQLEKYYRHYSSSERKELLLQLENPEMQNLLEKSVTEEQDFLAVMKEIKNVDFDQLPPFVYLKNAARLLFLGYFIAISNVT